MHHERPEFPAQPVEPDTAPPPPVVGNELDIESLPRGATTRVFVELVADGLAAGVRVPVLVARGHRPGPVFGITAAVHGNELNGIPVIHDLFARLDPATVRGCVVGVLVANVPGLHQHRRELSDGTDLNRIMPGRENGNVAEVYASRLIGRIINRFDYHVDLHTASFGRVNSLYVRADMNHEKSAAMAYLQRPQIIVHNEASDHTLRGAAMEMGIPSITVEIGDPQRFQRRFIKNARIGLRAVLSYAGVVRKRPVADGPEPVICSSSSWMYTDRGGLLEVLPGVTYRVAEGEVVGRIRNAFGDVIREYKAPIDGIVVGRSVNPVGQTGARILHLGRVAEPDVFEFLRRRGSRLSASDGS